MTDTNAPESALVRPFPSVGPLMELAYRELNLAANGTPEQRILLGDPRRLPRPWDHTTCTSPQLRQEVWEWLEDVVTWLNHDYTWDPATMIPSCWPHHPHLVHELAVLADQRRTAEVALNSDPVEDWHRYSLPFFIDRMNNRLRTHCENGHEPSPSRGRQARHTSPASRQERAADFARELAPTRD